jgi:hypothetical protein
MSNVVSAHISDDNALSVTFGRAGTIATIPNGGIDLNDGEFASWTEQQTAWLEIIPRWPARDLTLRFTASPFLVEDRITHQQVFLYVNGLFCGLANLFEPQDCTFVIPRNAVSGRATRITLAIPTAISPKHLGLSEDVRILGVALTALSLTAQ